MPEATVNLGELEPYDQAKALPLREARKLILNSSQQPVHPEVMRRWTRTGRRVGGRSVFLPSVKVGGAVMVMPSWVEAFRKTCERLGERQPVPLLERPRRTREAAQRRAAAALDRAGIRIVEEKPAAAKRKSG